jgi:4-amino-4-deoxy-L-arabinose transferase-like glycosyltransferase
MLTLRQRLSIGALLLAHVAVAFWAVSGKGIAYDEIFHVTGGYLYDRFGDYRIHPDNGVLPQRVHGLAPLLAGAQPPPMNDLAWRNSDQGVVGYQFFFTANSDHRSWLLGARALNLLFSAGVCLLAFLWARRLGGVGAGFVALTLTAFSPILLAHGALATSDAAAALLLGGATLAFQRQLDENSRRATALSTLLFGAACTAKFSAVILLPVFAGLVVLHIVLARCAWRPAVSKFALHLLGAWVLIWAAFGFRYAASAPGLEPLQQFLRSWEWIAERAGFQGSVVALVREWRLLPEAFLFGYAHTYVGSLARPAFLAGDFSETGWRTFFLWAALWKSSLAELAGAALVAGVALTRRGAWRARLLRWAPLLLLGVGYGGLSLASQLNIGHRHLLPLYPLLFVAIGVAVVRLGAWTRRAAGLLIATQLATAAFAFPHYLAFFNPLAGGPANGWRLLVDSSLDWGQELPATRRWLKTHNDGERDPVFISYFGSDQPAFHGIRATPLPFTTSTKFGQRWYEPRAGLYLVSATMLQQVYGPTRGRWTFESEALFRELRELAPQFRAAADARGHIADRNTYELWQRYDQLRFARLCFYLRARQPEAVIAHSVFVYRLTDDELDRVLRGDAAQWAAAIEQASSARR